MSGGADKRRAERLRGRFTVAVREKLATWITATEDVCARGCRIELRRPLSPGMLVQLAFDMGDGAEPLVAHGQVAWVRKTPPLSAGIAFLSAPRAAANEPAAQAGEWIDRLLGARVRRMPEAPKAAPRPSACAIIVPPAA